MIHMYENPHTSHTLNIKTKDHFHIGSVTSYSKTCAANHH